MLTLTFIRIQPLDRIFFPFYIQRKRGLGGSVPKATKLPSGRTGTQPRAYLAANLHHATVNGPISLLGKRIHNGNLFI